MRGGREIVGGLKKEEKGVGERWSKREKGKEVVGEKTLAVLPDSAA